MMHLVVVGVILFKGTRSRKRKFFPDFYLLFGQFLFCHISILLLFNCRSVCFMHMNKFSKCNKNEHL